jgi:hypothetical protein
MLGSDIVNRDSFHFKNWAYVFMKELEVGNYERLFVTIQPGVLTIYTNIIGFKTLYFLKDKLNFFVLEGKELEVMLNYFQMGAHNILILLLSFLIYFLIKNIYGYKISLLFLILYIFEPAFIIFSRYNQTDLPQSLLIFASLLSIILFLKSKNILSFLAAGVLGGLGFIEKSSTIAIIPFIPLLLLFSNYSVKEKLLSLHNIIKVSKLLFLYISIFFITAFLFFPAYWGDPIGIFLRMTLDAYIHGVGGVNLDSANFERPNNLGNPIKFSLNISLINHLLSNYSLIIIIGVIFSSIYLVRLIYKNKSLTEFQLRSYFLLLIFSLYYFLIVNISNLQFHRYLLVITIPLTLLSAFGWSKILSMLNKKFVKGELIAISVIVMIGITNYLYYVPDWGAYNNLLAKIIGNKNAFVEETGTKRLSEYLIKKYGKDKSIMITDYSSLYLFYPGEVIDYNNVNIGVTDIVINPSNDTDMESLGYQKEQEFIAKGNVIFNIFIKNIKL